MKSDSLGPVKSGLATVALILAVLAATIALPAYLDWRDANYMPAAEVVEPEDER